MRSWKTTAAILLLSTACKMSRAHEKAVIVTCRCSATEKREVAQRVVTETYGALGLELQQKFGLNPQQANGFYVRWEQSSFRGVGSAESSEPAVKVVVGTRNIDDDHAAEKVLDFAAAVVNVKIRDHVTALAKTE